MEKKKEILALEELVSISPEEFTEVMKTQNMGFLNSVKNFIQMYYEQVNVTKDSILALVHRGENMPIEDKKKAEETLNNLYIMLQILEDRFNIINALVTDKDRIGN